MREPWKNWSNLACPQKNPDRRSSIAVVAEDELGSDLCGADRKRDLGAFSGRLFSAESVQPAFAANSHFAPEVSGTWVATLAVGRRPVFLDGRIAPTQPQSKTNRDTDTDRHGQIREHGQNQSEDEQNPI